MERLSKSFSLNGHALIAREMNLGMDNKRVRLEEEARALRSQQNGTGDYAFLSFAEQIYPPLAASTEGEIPDVHSAYSLSDDLLDCWFENVQAVNSNWLSPRENIGETVTFRDGSKIDIVSGDIPSVLRRLYRLEKESENYRVDDDNLALKNFLYPRMAACSVGEVPTFEQALDMPLDEMNKWYFAARRCNPGWFMSLEQIAEQNKADALTQEKKTKRRPAKSSSS